MQVVEETRIAGLKINAPIKESYLEILTPEALSFVSLLSMEFETQREEILSNRKLLQRQIKLGRSLGFLKNTKVVRESEWKIAPIPKDLMDRRVEITGPVQRKMVVNALNSGAKTFMADFEDSHSPTFQNTIEGQINLRDAIRNDIDFIDPISNKDYKLNKKHAVLIVRPRGWHLDEKHIICNGKSISASIFDFALYFFHNAKSLMDKNTAPYFYLPKLEHFLEARLWNDVFIRAQQLLSIPKQTIKATVLIETLPAAFQMDEILYELRDHIAGLNCGRWDYIFSMIKKLHTNPEFILPDRSQVTMESHCMRSYSKLAIKTCHRRGALAIGGMAAQIPIKNDPAANQTAVAKVMADKKREVTDGHDGTWVAHPALVPVATEIFNQYMPLENQIDKSLEDLEITEEDLLEIPTGTITEEGVKTNIRVSLQYLASWIDGNGCVPINHLMEDAATVEISRSQLWHWIRHPEGKLESGEKLTFEYIQNILKTELTSILNQKSKISPSTFKLAGEIFINIIQNNELEEFITLKAYREI